MAQVATPLFPEVPSPRQVLRKWLESILNGGGYDITDLRTQAKAELLDDPAFSEAAAAAWIDEMIPEVVADAAHQRRRDIVHIYGNSIRSAEAVEQDVKAKLERWYERASESQHKSILDMSRPELIFSVSHREETVKSHLRVIKFERSLIKGLDNDRQIVRNRYSSEQIQGLWDAAFTEETK
jgi:hypothetical protein